MSINLYLRESQNGPEMGLWQTPTHITLMCLSSDPVTGEPDGGHEAVRKRYLYWVESQSNGVYQDKEDLNWIKQRIKEHKDAVLAVKSPFFYYI